MISAKWFNKHSILRQPFWRTHLSIFNLLITMNLLLNFYLNNEFVFSSWQNVPKKRIQGNVVILSSPFKSLFAHCKVHPLYTIWKLSSWVIFHKNRRSVSKSLNFAAKFIKVGNHIRGNFSSHNDYSCEVPTAEQPIYLQMKIFFFALCVRDAYVQLHARIYVFVLDNGNDTRINSTS